MVLRPDGSPARVGQVGEVVVRSPHLAAGYLGNERYGGFDRTPGAYHTGDRGRWDLFGSVVLDGRLDRQVTVDGHRLDPEQVERAALRHPAIRQALVRPRETPAGPVLTLWAVPAPGSAVPAVAELRAHLRAYLPRYAVPAEITLASELVIGGHHKVVGARPIARPAAPRQPADGTLDELTALVREVIGTDVAPTENFFEAGLSSVTLVRLHAVLNERLATDLPVTAMFEYPNLAALARFVATGAPERPAALVTAAGRTPGTATPSGAGRCGNASITNLEGAMNQSGRDEPIAIIGMAGRFPGADDVDQFWHNLSTGVESVRTPSDEELLAAGVPAAALTDPDYVKATAGPADADAFDAELFRMTPREARICDPQMRMFLECAHAAIENAGYDHTQLTDVGVFGSAGPNHYVDLVRRAEGADLRGVAGMVDKLNLVDYLAPLVSYKLGLRGPSMAVAAACSSSLVTVHLAAAALRAGECELALAGGVDLLVPFGHGYWWEQDGTLSREGRCRPFDKAASGVVYTSGAGMVLLKRLSDALADRDHIRAVILATAVTNDGGTSVGLAAPSVRGQAAVIAEAMSLAGVRSQDVSMVEAHAVGSPLGDQIEVAALTSAFRRQGEPVPGGCALGSVKGNIGHVGRAAGVASLIKVALALENETIPPSGGFTEPNPDLRLAESPFFVAGEAIPWPRQRERPRYASLNAFGYGGSNAHAVLTEAPAPVRVTVPATPRVVVWSARTPQAATPTASASPRTSRTRTVPTRPPSPAPSRPSSMDGPAMPAAARWWPLTRGRRRPRCGAGRPWHDRLLRMTAAAWSCCFPVWTLGMPAWRTVWRIGRRRSPRAWTSASTCSRRRAYRRGAPGETATG